jgi:hypothetical protein
MDGTAVRGELTLDDRPGTSEGLHFEIANEGHDAALRQLLRDTPLAGSISVSLEREPSFFAAESLLGPEHQTLVALENGRVVAAGSISARQRFINGEAMRVGYLSTLRLSQSCRGRSAILRRGYAEFQRIHARGGPPIYLSSIIADNEPARKFLERGLEGMPTYLFLGEFITLVIQCRRLRALTGRARGRLEGTGFQVTSRLAKNSHEIAGLLNRHNQNYQFAPVWSAQDICPDNMEVVNSRTGAPVACAGIWDQRAVKQSVVRGYSGTLRRVKPFLNLAATVMGTPRLPPIRSALSHVYASHLAADADPPEITQHLINLIRARGDVASADYVTVGFDARDSRLPYLRKVFRPREYKGRMYVVFWEDGATLARSLDDRLLAPEVATL